MALSKEMFYFWTNKGFVCMIYSTVSDRTMGTNIVRRVEHYERGIIDNTLRMFVCIFLQLGNPTPNILIL